MKRNKGAKKTRDTLQVWSLNQARAAIPYLSSVLRSMREHVLVALAANHRAKRIATKPGRTTRLDMVAIHEAEHEARQAEARFQEAAGELEEIDVFTLDPVRGQALIPFVQDEQLAWYIFDLFDNKPFRFWRFQSDPEDTRRPITPTQQGWTGTTQLA
jgi:hypothetical protein